MVLTQLIREIEKRGNAQGWSAADVAASLGVHRSRVSHVRRGRGRLSLGSLHELAHTFADDTTIRDLAWAYLAFDLPCRRSGRSRPAATSLDERTAERLTDQLLRRLPGLLVRGELIALECADPSRLAASLDFLQAGCVSQGAAVMRIRLSDSIGKESRRFLLSTPALLVDPGRSPSATMRDVLERRAEAARLTIVGTTTEGVPVEQPFRRLSVQPASAPLTPAAPAHA